ncbi:MAG: hypothetical protein QXH61_06475 [Candidatus Nezhaarchaeales archaeon]
MTPLSFHLPSPQPPIALGLTSNASETYLSSKLLLLEEDTPTLRGLGKLL